MRTAELRLLCFPTNRGSGIATNTILLLTTGLVLFSLGLLADLIVRVADDR